MIKYFNICKYIVYIYNINKINILFKLLYALFM